MTSLKLGVIGHPISHSKSPLIHNYWLDQYGISGTYTAIDIVPDDLQARLKQLQDSGYNGLNVTVPHKEQVIELCDDLADNAKIIGAVNTLVLKENGKISGHNTDAHGFIRNISVNAPNFDFGASNAFIIGAGGAARAAIYGLIVAGCMNITITNRTREKAELLAHEFQAWADNTPPGANHGHVQINVADWDDKSDATRETGLLVNTTSLGMAGQPPLEIDLSRLNKTAYVHDIVYAPLMTPLLTTAHQRGNPVITGIGMLLHQAAKSFEIWSGQIPEVSSALQDMVLSKS